jgi:hypothetical protein
MASYETTFPPRAKSDGESESVLHLDSLTENLSNEVRDLAVADLVDSSIQVRRHTTPHILLATWGLVDSFVRFTVKLPAFDKDP